MDNHSISSIYPWKMEDQTSQYYSSIIYDNILAHVYKQTSQENITNKYCSKERMHGEN